MAFVFFLLQLNNEVEIEIEKQANVLRMDIEGIILDAKAQRPFLDKAFEEDIRGVLVVVNSGGGGVGASIELSETIKQIAQIKPVVVYSADKMASGAYYASIWANKIISNPGSLIGSIGVVYNGFNLEKLINKLGIQTQIIKKGAYKETGTPMRDWNVQETEQMNRLLDKVYERFTTQVALARNLDIKASDDFANGRVFYAQEAKDIGLIDDLGTLRDAQLALKKMSGIDEMIWYEEPVDEVERYLNMLTESFVGAIWHKVHSYNGLLF